MRWQIVPAYLMILAFFFLQRKTSKFTTVSLVAGLVVSVLLPLLVPIISFPDPRGDYAVGSLIHHWVDGDRDEWFTPEDPNDKRQLMLQTWYPSIETNSEKLPFLDHLKIRAKTIAQAGKFPSFLAMHLERIKTNSVLNSPVLSEGHHFQSSSYPMVLPVCASCTHLLLRDWQAKVTLFLRWITLTMQILPCFQMGP